MLDRFVDDQQQQQQPKSLAAAPVDRFITMFFDEKNLK
jgi:hypothetical protein